MSEILNVGIIGLAGDHGSRSHGMLMPDLADVCRVTMAADLDTEGLSKWRSVPGYEDVELVDDYTRIIGSPKVDAIINATGDRLHMPIAEAAILSGKHILGEKPLATTREEYERLKSLVAYAREIGRVLMPCNPRIFDQPLTRMRDFLTNRGSLADVFGGDALDLGGVHSIAFDSHYTEPDPAKSGLHSSFVADKENHNIVAAGHLLGEDEIHGGLTSTLHVTDDRRYSLTHVTQSGVEISSHAIRSIPREDTDQGGRKNVYRETIEVGFRSGKLHLDTLTGELSLTYRDSPVRREAGSDLKIDYDRQFRALMRHFVDCAVNGTEQTIPDRTKLLSTLAALALEEAGPHQTIELKV